MIDEVIPVQTRVGIVHNEFNFTDMINSIELILDYEESRDKSILSTGLVDLKTELNKFFNDSVCREVIYTDNTDKMFFGMTIMPYIDGNKIYSFLDGDEKLRVNQYYLELDSKLFSPMLQLNSREITAILLHEIGHIVNDSSSIQCLRKNIANYTISNGPLRTTENINYKEILSFGIKDSLRKTDSIFDKKDDEVIADEFVIAYGFGDYLQSALEKIVKYTSTIHRDIMTDKYMVLSWSLALYNDILKRRIPALYLIRKMIDICPSYYERRELKNLDVRLRRIDDDAVLGNYNLQEGVRLTKGLQLSSVKQYEAELYELSIQVRSVQREDDALILVRRINSHIGVLSEIIEEEYNQEDPNTNNIKRYNELLGRYIKLRDILASKTLDKDDYNRIIIQYPPINNYSER